MAEEDEDKTVFHTGKGIYCYIKMPFGLKNVGATYQRLIDSAFESQIGRNLKAHVDDLTAEADSVFQEMKELLATLPTLTAPVKGEFLYLYISIANEAFGFVLITELKQVLNKPEISERLAKWAIELGSYEITYLPRISVKGQDLADYLAEMTGELEVIHEKTKLKPVQGETWDLFTDGASCVEGAGAGLIFTSPSGEEHTYALRFNFDVTNNEAEYEALLAGLNIVLKLNITKLRTYVDSQLVFNQFNSSFDAHELSIQKYLKLLKETTVKFEHFELAQQVWVEELPNKVIDGGLVVAAIEEVQPNWMNPIIENLRNNILPEDKDEVEAKALRTITRVQAQNFVWEYIIYRFGIPREIVSENVELKKCLNEKWTGLVDELSNVLWAHHTTFKKSTGETPFCLVYGSEAMIPAEFFVPTHRAALCENFCANDDTLCENLNFVEERRLMAAIKEANNKQQIAKYYNKKVRALAFDVGEWVLRNNEASRVENVGKLVPNWEGPYQIIAINVIGSYKLAKIDGRIIPNAWRATLLKRY
ncbi:uncharacterized protein [Rutidosis leptorrhynchoides]|uniref:uncharacterized protein n=1 Tax=Rutidosis leptorrhynchoides TaxID=125765 RepID=UPI003A99A278